MLAAAVESLYTCDETGQRDALQLWRPKKIFARRVPSTFWRQRYIIPVSSESTALCFALNLPYLHILCLDCSHARNHLTPFSSGLCGSLAVHAEYNTHN